uniref:Transmembrane protein 154 n=1 Tax=Dicentrarchus labrax TaxID=13489 RepID=A0A8C4I5D4_DICLA
MAQELARHLMVRLTNHDLTSQQSSTPETDDPSVTDTSEESLSFIIILIPVVLVVLIISMIVCGIFINRRWNKKLKQEDPYLDGCSTEKVPMPMFEEDVPSVLELEMEELDQWMKKDAKVTAGWTLL